MNIAVSNLAWAGHDSGPYHYLLADLNITGLEVAPKVLLGEDLDIHGSLDGVHAHRKKLAEHGLSVAGLQSLYFGHPEFQFADGPTAGERLVVHSERMVELCCALGGSYLLIGSPANRRLGGRTLADAEKHTAETLRRIGEYAAARGVWFSIEALDDRYGCQLGCTLADIARLIDMADSAGVRPHLDTGTTDPSAANPFAPADFGSLQVSVRAGVGIVGDPDQRRWANFLAAAPTPPPWLSLELPPPTHLTFAENSERIALGLKQVAEVFQCR